MVMPGMGLTTMLYVNGLPGQGALGGVAITVIMAESGLTPGLIKLKEWMPLPVPLSVPPKLNEGGTTILQAKVTPGVVELKIIGVLLPPEQMAWGPGEKLTLGEPSTEMV